MAHPSFFFSLIRASTFLFFDWLCRKSKAPNFFHGLRLLGPLGPLGSVDPIGPLGAAGPLLGLKNPAIRAA
jgi:hypothetical protein